MALAWCFEDEQTPEIMGLLDRVVDEGAVAPQLWPLEAVNGLLMAQRRGRVDAAERRRLASLLHALPITIDDETVVQVWSATQAIAEAHGLTAYDASYLELALRIATPLATSDRALAAAAKSRGVPLFLGA